MKEVHKVNESPVTYAIQEKVLVGGDLSKLTVEERLSYIKNLCESLSLNPLTRPFEYITLNGKLQLYARKDATEQLRKINKISIDKIEEEIIGDIYKVKAYAVDGEGRHDVSTGAVSVLNVKGDNLANAIMKAETKAKRRVTLSISGLGFLDESEIETIPEVKERGSIHPSKKESKQVKTNLKLIHEQSRELEEKILSSTTMEELKANYSKAFKFAFNLKRDDLVELFTQYKDAKKAELKKYAEGEADKKAQEYFNEEETVVKSDEGKFYKENNDIF